MKPILNEEEQKRYLLLAHMSNARKTDEQFKEWQDLRRKNGDPVPTEKHRYTTHRALHDKYDKDDKEN